ncbi:MAG: DUF4347 domain-containing protein, partial [Cyanobacteria bacterium P01_F01_bin.153]
MRSSLFIVDSRVADVDQLLEGIEGSARVLHIDPEESAIAQISQALAASPDDVDRLEILSHGQPGGVLLGCDSLDATKLIQSKRHLENWGRILGKAGEIILHGCQVGAGQVGRAFVEQLHRLTGAGVAANRDITGGESTGGSWNFEVLAGGTSGASHLSWQTRHAYAHTLATFTVSSGVDDGSGNTPGTLSEAIKLANANPGADTIELANEITLFGVMTRIIT